MSIKPRFRTPFDSQYVKGCQTLLISARQHVYHIFTSIWGKLSWKLTLLVRSKILGLFHNVLTAHGKISLGNRENVPQPIQIQLFKKEKKIIQLLLHF